MTSNSEKKSSLKEKLAHEFKEMVVIFLYLAIFFCAFTTYRRLTLRELGAAFPHYGLALLKALVLAKVIFARPVYEIGKVFRRLALDHSDFV